MEQEGSSYQPKHIRDVYLSNVKPPGDTLASMYLHTPIGTLASLWKRRQSAAAPTHIVPALRHTFVPAGILGAWPIPREPLLQSRLEDAKLYTEYISARLGPYLAAAGTNWTTAALWAQRERNVIWGGLAVPLGLVMVAILLSALLGNPPRQFVPEHPGPTTPVAPSNPVQPSPAAPVPPAPSSTTPANNTLPPEGGKSDRVVTSPASSTPTGGGAPTPSVTPSTAGLPPTFGKGGGGPAAPRPQAAAGGADNQPPVPAGTPPAIPPPSATGSAGNTSATAISIQPSAQAVATATIGTASALATIIDRGHTLSALSIADTSLSCEASR